MIPDLFVADSSVGIKWFVPEVHTADGQHRAVRGERRAGMTQLMQQPQSAGHAGQRVVLQQHRAGFASRQGREGQAGQAALTAQVDRVDTLRQRCLDLAPHQLAQQGRSTAGLARTLPLQSRHGLCFCIG